MLRGGVLTTLDAPGSAGVTHAYGINNAGDAVGDYVDAAGRTHGFLLHDGRYTTLDGPGMSTQTVASQIDGAGDIVGSYTDAHDVSHGFLLHDDVYVTLDDPVATGGTSGNGIDDAGDVVGAIVRNGERYGFLLRDGMYMTINARQESDAQRTGCPPPGALCRVTGAGCRGHRPQGDSTGTSPPGPIHRPLTVGEPRNAAMSHS